MCVCVCVCVCVWFAMSMNMDGLISEIGHIRGVLNKLPDLFLYRHLKLS